MDDVSVVCEGPLSGRDLRELIRSYGGSLLGSLGRELFPDRFPLLVKTGGLRQAMIDPS